MHTGRIFLLFPVSSSNIVTIIVIEELAGGGTINFIAKIGGEKEKEGKEIFVARYSMIKENSPATCICFRIYSDITHQFPRYIRIRVRETK